MGAGLPSSLANTRCSGLCLTLGFNRPQGCTSKISDNSATNKPAMSQVPYPILSQVPQRSLLLCKPDLRLTKFLVT